MPPLHVQLYDDPIRVYTILLSDFSVASYNFLL